MNTFTRTAAIARAKKLARENDRLYVVLDENHYDPDLSAKWIAVSYNSWFYSTDTTPYYCSVNPDGEISYDQE